MLFLPWANMRTRVSLAMMEWRMRTQPSAILRWRAFHSKSTCFLLLFLSLSFFPLSLFGAPLPPISCPQLMSLSIPLYSSPFSSSFNHPVFLFTFPLFPLSLSSRIFQFFLSPTLFSFPSLLPPFCLCVADGCGVDSRCCRLWFPRGIKTF